MSAAEEVFVDAEPFRAAFLAAMNEASSGSIAALCKDLRTEPQSIAALKRSRSFSIRRMRPSDVLTKSLRAEIVAARNLLNADRAERAGATAHIGHESDELRAIASVIVPAGLAPASPPPVALTNAGDGEVEKAHKPVDMVALVADVSSEAEEWVEDVKAAVASTVTGERRADFEADVERIGAVASLFQDTPDDLHQLF